MTGAFHFLPRAWVAGGFEFHIYIYMSFFEGVVSKGDFLINC